MRFVQLTFDIPQAGRPWGLVRKIRDEVFVLLADQPHSLRECAAMAASELAENALKYGSPLDHIPMARVEVTLTDAEIIIAAKNGLRESSQAAQVADIIEQLAAGVSPEDLYVQRLLDLLREPSSDESRLGLLRIAHEGEFHLECECTGNVLLVKATRKLFHG